MSVVRRITALALVGALALPLGGCLEGVLRETGPLGLFMVLFSGGGGFSTAKSKKKIKFKDKSDVELSGSFGGLSGTYDIDVGTYGTVSGTADIKGSFNARIKDRELDEGVAGVIEAAVLDRFDVEIDVTSTNSKYKGRQTRGGVKKIYNGKVKFAGVVLSGEHAGSTVKGAMTAKGKFE